MGKRETGNGGAYTGLGKKCYIHTYRFFVVVVLVVLILHLLVLVLVLVGNWGF